MKTLSITIGTILFCFCNPINGQSVTSYVNEPTFSIQQVKEDIEILYESLVHYHAEPHFYISADSLRIFKNILLSNAVRYTESDVHLLARKLVAKIKCGHTYVKPTEEWLINVKAEASFLPFDVIKISDKYYINRTIDKPFDFRTGTEILCINDIPIAQIWDNASDIIERDGYITTLVDHKISNSFRTYFYFLFGKQEKFEIKFKNNSGELLNTIVRATKEKLKQKVEFKLAENFELQQSNSWSVFGIDSVSSIAYLRINHFANRDEYEDYYSDVFEFLKNNPNVKDLIIDLRGNSGGYFKNGDELLKYLLTDERFYFKFYRSKRDWDKNKHVSLSFQNWLTKIGFALKPDKFKYINKRTYSFDYKPYLKKTFDGNLHIIIDGETFSQASLVASSLKDIGATFYGEETGGTANGNNAMLMYSLVLPNSNIKVSIPYYRIVTKNSDNYPYGRGVIPDEIIKTNEIQFFASNKNKDRVLKKVINSIKKNND